MIFSEWSFNKLELTDVNNLTYVNKLQSDKIQLNMRSDLLQNERERVYEGEDNCKIVEVRILSGSLTANKWGDQPIFKEKDLSYDEQQLAKLISFEQFELLIRPFKNDPAFKEYLVSDKLLRGTASLMLLFILFYLFESYQKDETLLRISVVGFITSVALFNVLIIYNLYKMGKANRALVEYCKRLDLSHQQMEISVAYTQQERNIFRWMWRDCEYPGVFSLCILQITHFEIKYYRFFEEEDLSIKLYKRGMLFSALNTDLDQPLFQPMHFDFRKGRLQKIITFEELEKLLRPFKRNQAFIRMVSWSKRILWATPLFLFMFVPLFVDAGENFLVIYSVSQMIVLDVIFIFLVCKMFKAKKQAAIEFAEYCKKVSTNRIAVIMHMHEKFQSKSKPFMFYCLQIKNIAN